MKAESSSLPVSRRRFLSHSAAAVACAAAGRAWAAQAPTPWKMRLATSSIHYASLPIDEACRRIAALGFEAIDLWSPYTGCPHLDDAKDRLGAEGLKELLDRIHLKPYAYSVYIGGLAKYADFIGALGGGVAVRGSERPCPPEGLSARMKEFVESLKPELELAEKHDAYLAIENHGNALLDSLDSLKAFVDVNRNPRLGIALAPYHLQRGGVSVEDAIAVCGKQLLFFYAWQNQPGKQQLPGIGPMDFTPWLAALAKIDYRGYVNPFMHGEVEPDAMTAALRKSREYLLERVPSRRSRPS